MKQETLAEELGISQQGVSHIEQSETIEEDKLQWVAKVQGVSKEAIESFSEENLLNFINNFNNSVNHWPLNNHHCTFNPLEKLVESYKANPKLYECRAQAEKDKISYLEKLLNK